MAEAEPAPNVEDLEDGEIGSEEEDTKDDKNEEEKEDKEETKPEMTEISNAPVDNADQYKEHQDQHKDHQKKSGKKKKKGKQKEKNKVSRNFENTVEDDFAGNIEKAIRKAMNKQHSGDSNQEDMEEERRKRRKRSKKLDGNQGPNKKRSKQEYPDEVDETEMMCVRGASPVQKQANDTYQDEEDERDSYVSDSSNESRGQQQQHQQRKQRNRQQKRERERERDNRNNKNSKNDRRRQNAHPNQDPDGVCLYFMQGKCHKGDDCIYSHNANPPRKMELCKFYLMECCAKRDKCLYMHSDFPCKYYHTGIPCIYKDECKFAHGKPLTDNLKNILLKHIESAPKEILGDFPRLNREGAMKMIQTTQNKLMQQFNVNPNEGNYDPNNMQFDQSFHNQQMVESSQQFTTDRQNKSAKVRQSRWQNDNSNQNFNVNYSSGGSAPNVLDIKNLTGVLTPRQISDLGRMGIENLDQLTQLTVLQLNSIGISLKQITEIQMNTMSIQKLGLLSNTETAGPTFNPPIAQDLDLRVPPVLSVPSTVTTSNTVTPSDMMGMDVDMRFQASSAITTSTSDMVPAIPIIPKIVKKEPGKDTIDIDQYTKDALKFASKEKENIDVSNEPLKIENPLISNEVKDVDHRVLPFSDETIKTTHAVALENVKKSRDTDIRFLQPEPIFKQKSPEKRHRRSTTDDEDNNLCIDEKWYSSDEEKGNKRKSPVSSPRPHSSPRTLAPPVIEPSSVISKLGDLSKIDISEEVTKLLNTMKNNLHEHKSESPVEASQSPRSTRDPRAKRSPPKSSDNTPTTSANVKVFNKRAPRVSIYECIDGEPTDGRRRSDVDLRKPDFPAFGDTDLRSVGGDIDLRLGLPFKAIPNYTPASEINCSINNHPPIPWKLATIDIPRPDYTDIKNSTAKSQALVDPRLRKVFRLSVEESNSDSEKPAKPIPATATTPRIDPRRKKDTGDVPEKSNSLDIQVILQNSDWFKELSTTQKISVNQLLLPVTQMVKQYHNEKVPGVKFDTIPIQGNSVVCAIFSNLGITVDENAEYVYLPKPKEALLNTPVGFNQPPNPFGNLDPAMGMMNNMNMPPMGMAAVGAMPNMPNMNMPPMHGFPGMADPRGGPTPGLLGIAPNIPHNFNNFGPNNFGGMGFNGPNQNNFNFMDGDPNFQRFPNRGGGRPPRGGDRWNRGGPAGNNRGHRDRKNFNDRGKWKNDRS